MIIEFIQFTPGIMKKPRLFMLWWTALFFGHSLYYFQYYLSKGSLLCLLDLAAMFLQGCSCAWFARPVSRLADEVMDELKRKGLW